MSEYDKSLTVTFDGLDEAQALALQSMFEVWSSYTTLGASRLVSYFVDGDGHFSPDIEIEKSDDVRELTDTLKEAAEPETNKFDHDGVAWKLREVNDDDV